MKIKKSLSNKKKLPKLVTSVPVFLLICFVLAGLFILYITYLKPSVCMDLLPDAGKVIDLDDIREHKKIVSEAKSIKGFDKDPDCLAVIVSYNIKAGDAKEARKNLNSLTRTYSSFRGYDSSIEGIAKPPDQFEKEVRFLEQQDFHLFEAEGLKVEP